MATVENFDPVMCCSGSGCWWRERHRRTDRAARGRRPRRNHQPPGGL